MKQLPLPVWKGGLIWEVNPVIQPCPSSWLSVKPLCLSKQLIIFIIAPNSLGCAKSCHCPKRRRSVPRFRLTGSQTLRHQLFKVCEYVQFHRSTSISPAGYQSQVIWRCPVGGRCKNQGSRRVYKVFYG